MLSEKEQELVDKWLETNKVTVCKPSTCYIQVVDSVRLLADITTNSNVKIAIPRDIPIFEGVQYED